MKILSLNEFVNESARPLYKDEDEFGKIGIM